jgi:hypothetical protein
MIFHGTHDYTIEGWEGIILASLSIYINDTNLSTHTISPRFFGFQLALHLDYVTVSDAVFPVCIFYGLR